MKKQCIAVLFGLIMLSTPVFPAGFGFFGTGGYGKVDMMRIIDNGSDYRVTYSSKHSLYGAGLMLETGDESKEYHNRLNAGVDGAAIEGGRFQYRRSMRFKIDNVFAFRIAGNEQVRFWIGPLIGIHLLTGHAKSTRNSEWSTDKLQYHMLAIWSPLIPNDYRLYGLYYIYSEKIWKRKFGVFIPVGLALGFNITLAENAALTVEAGFRCGFYSLRNSGFNYEGYGNVGFLFGAI